jgi:hypothetical protein
MSSLSCLLCHQPRPDVHVDLLRVMRPPLGSREGAWRWTYDRHHYCQSCYRKAVRAQTVQQLVTFFMILLPMAWFMFGGVLLYGVVCSNPATMPLETHLLFAVSSLAGFVLIPYWISKLVKQPLVSSHLCGNARPAGRGTRGHDGCTHGRQIGERLRQAGEFLGIAFHAAK